jgi:hypothetical protein
MTSIEAAESPRRAKQPAKGKSRITNCAELLPDITDWRAGPARRFRDLVRSYLVDQGGEENCSEVKIGLMRRLAGIVVQSELLEARMVNGEEIDVLKLCTLASTCVRISQRLGLSRHTREINPPGVAEYLQHREREKAAS